PGAVVANPHDPPGAVSSGQSGVKTPEVLSGGLLPALPTLSRRLWPSRPAHGRFRPCLQARYARPATAAIRREAPGAQATSPVPASGADHEKHDRTSPNTHGPPSSDRSRRLRALPCLEGVAQDLEVPTATRSGIRRLAGDHQSRRSLERSVQAAFARGAVHSSRSVSTGAPPVSA